MIGIFDSGVGGMTVARAIEKALPGFQQIYFGDLARTPYGSKSPATITGYALENSEFLLSRGAKLIVVACNSAASVAAKILPEKVDVPVLEVISPAVEKAVRATRNGRIGVIGTRATIASGVYEREILARDAGFKVFSSPCPLLVPLVEEGWLDNRETKMIIRRYLSGLKQNSVDTLVLGCTHYPLLKDLIQHRIGKKVTIIDSSEEIAVQLKSFLRTHPTLAEQLAAGIGGNQYYVSDLTRTAASIARKIFGREIDLIQTKI